MPLPPSRYMPGPVASQQLNTDLYGYPGTPSGVVFHGNRPLLSETVITGATYSPLTWQAVNQAGIAAYSVIDTTALFCAGADTPGTGSRFRFGNTVPASGGAVGNMGGWWLNWNFPVTGNVTAPPAAVGAGQTSGGTFTNDPGTVQYGGTSTASLNCPWFLDITQAGSGVTFSPAFYWLNATTPVIKGNTADTSGTASRMGWLWQCVSTGGSALAAVPSVAQNWSTVTSANLNGMGSALALLNNPPSLRVSGTLSQSFTNNTLAAVTFAGAPNLDNYAGWSTATSAYTVPLPGLYLFSPTVAWGTASSSGDRWAGLLVSAGGTVPAYRSGSYKATAVGPGVSGVGLTVASKATVLSLNAGDTVSAYGQQNSGVTVPLYNGYRSRLMGTWMAPRAGAGTVLTWTPPVTGYRFQAGALSGTALTAALNSRIGNDVNFLLNRPYFTGFQQTAQSGFGDNSGWHQVTIDTLGALPRGGNGDSYGGWSTADSWYAAQVPGWYLVIADLYATAPAGTAGTLSAGIYVSSSGGITPAFSPDSYQQVCSPDTAFQPGATAIGMYYLAAGEYVYPMLQARLWGASWGTFNSSSTAHTVYPQFSVFWQSNLSRAGRRPAAARTAPEVRERLPADGLRARHRPVQRRRRRDRRHPHHRRVAHPEAGIQAGAGRQRQERR